MVPWAHGHQLKAIRDFVAAIIARQSGCQAQLARGFGNQEAACKRLSRLLHNPRLEPRHLADAVLLQALHQLPTQGKVRLAIDWTIEGDQHLLVVSLVIGYRAVPIYWRAYAASVLKGRMQRYELAIIRRAVHRVAQVAGKRRVLVTADRGFADVVLFDVLEALGVAFIIRVKRGTMVCMTGGWCKLHTLRFHSNHRHRSFGRLLYCQRAPHAVWLTMSRARDKAGHWGIWYLVSNRSHPADKAAAEYRHRSGCEAGFRDAKWWLGFAQARVKCVHAWSRMFALFAIALMIVVTLATKLLLGPRRRASALLRRVVSRRHKRCELGLISAMVSLLTQAGSLYEHLSPHVKLKLEGQLANVS
jgi:hypothetical protein